MVFNSLTMPHMPLMTHRVLCSETTSVSYSRPWRSRLDARDPCSSVSRWTGYRQADRGLDDGGGGGAIAAAAVAACPCCSARRTAASDDELLDDELGELELLDDERNIVIFVVLENTTIEECSLV